MARKSSAELTAELEERLDGRSSEEIAQYLGNYFSSDELNDFLDFLEDEN